MHYGHLSGFFHAAYVIIPVMDTTNENRVSIRDALEYASDELREEGIESPMLEARILLSEAMGVDQIYLITHDRESLGDDAAARFNSFMTQRLARRPVAYITGKKEFYKRTFRVRDGVLIPRPETEGAVECAVEYADRYAGNVRVLDLCCGSGAIGLSVALEVPRSYVTLSDISETAVAQTVENASLLGAENCEIIRTDLFEDMEPGSFDIIISNPPYVTGDEMDTLSQDIQLWEPREALYGGVDGLSFYRHIIAEAPVMFRNRGTLILEIGALQGDDVRTLLEKAGYEDITVRKDLSGLDRIVCAQHSGSGGMEVL